MIKELKKGQVFFFPSSLLTGHFCIEKLHSVQVHIMFLLQWCFIFLLLLLLIRPVIWHWYWISFVVTTLAQILSFKFYHHSSRNRYLVFTNQANKNLSVSSNKLPNIFDILFKWKFSTSVQEGTICF